MSPETPKQPHHVTFAIQTTGLTAWHGDRVICICAMDSRGGVFQESKLDEHEIIMGFLDWLFYRKQKDHFLLTRNGKLFHVPFLCARLELDSGLSRPEKEKRTKRLLSYEHLDLQEAVNKSDPRGELPSLLDATPQSGDRKYACRLFKKELYEKLVTYSMKSVTATEETFQKKNKGA